MPIYEYFCRAYVHPLEAMQKMGNAPLTDCPLCAAKGGFGCAAAK